MIIPNNIEKYTDEELEDICDDAYCMGVEVSEVEDCYKEIYQEWINDYKKRTSISSGSNGGLHT